MLQKLFCSNRSELVLYFKHSWSEISKKGEIFATDLYGGTSSEFANMLSHSGLVQFINCSVNGNISVMHRCKKLPCNHRKIPGIILEAIWIVFKFMQTNGKINDAGKDQTQLHPTANINYANTYK